MYDQCTMTRIMCLCAIQSFAFVSTSYSYTLRHTDCLLELVYLGTYVRAACKIATTTTAKHSLPHTQSWAVTLTLAGAKWDSVGHASNHA